MTASALDNNLETFCEMADPVEFKSINSVTHERSTGLGDGIPRHLAAWCP